MKLLLLHGPSISDSRKYLTNIKQKFNSNNVLVFEETASRQDVMGGLMAQPMLEEERLIILENPSEDFSPDLSLITDNSPLIIWFDHKLLASKPILQWASKSGEILFFDEQIKSSVFPLLDVLAERDGGNIRKAFLEIKKLKDLDLDIFYLITMSYYLLRNLSTTPKNAPEFVRKKLEKQRQNFSKEQIKIIYKKVLEIEFKLKNGMLQKEQAELLLVNLFLQTQNHGR